MADGAAGTPGSSTSKTPAVKDKECPYCHQAFTSSSLGRHLDLYIKDKNAKPPDDVHDVDAIRRLRGNVTRRQARTSSGKREGSTPSSTKPTPFRDQRSPSIQGSYGHSGQSEGNRIRTYLNKATWEATGVINDIPAVSETVAFVSRNSPSRRTSVKEEIMHKQNMMELRDRARAAELALEEVLGSIQAANSRAHPPSPFNFNFFALCFPELCLQCLSSPPVLLATASVSEQSTWSTDPPQVAHYERLREWLGRRLKEWRRQRNLYFAQSHGHSNGTNGHLQDHFDSENPSEVEEKYYQHISHTFDAWKGLSEKQKQERWREVLAKAFAREQERHQETKRRLELAEQEILHLRSQLDQIHQPPEFSAFTASTLPITRETAANLAGSHSWNSETLISRMKSRLQTTRSTQHPLPIASPWATAPPPNLNTNHMNGTTAFAQFRSESQQPYRNEDAHAPSEEDEDLADAPGDEEELDHDHAQHHGLDKGMLDPNLRDENGVREADGEGHAGGRMLMGLSQYASETMGETNGMEMGR